MQFERTPYERAFAIQGWMTREELGFLYTLATRLPDEASVVEVGNWKGRSTIAICEGLRSKRAPRLYAVDTFLGDEGMRQRHRDEILQGAIYNEFLGNTSEYPFVHVLRLDSVRASRTVEDRSIDWVFIDAEHTYEQVSADITAWFPKLRPGGIISGHDFGRFEVRRAVRAHLEIEGVEGSIWYAQRRARRRTRAPASAPIDVKLRAVVRSAPLADRAWSSFRKAMQRLRRVDRCR